MQAHLDVLHLYVEIIIAYVAFAAIVATLRQSFGNKLTSLQYTLFRWFVEVGLLLAFLSFTIIVLANVIEAEIDAWKYSTLLIVIAITLYMFSYLRRRSRLKIVMPASSKFVITGHVCLILFLTFTLTEWVWIPSFEAILIYFTWALASLFIVFVQFLILFIDIETDGDQ